MPVLNRTLAISLPVVGLSVCGLIASRINKLKREGRITSVKALLNAFPIIIKTKRYIRRKKNVEKDYHFNQMGGHIKIPNPLSQLLRPPEKGDKPFLLCDHWKCRESDVLVAVPSKSGTGWVLQICQQLRVGGDDNINFYQDLLDVCPFLETILSELFAKNKERPIPPDPTTMPEAFDMDADHKGTNIRVFKSHLGWKFLEGTNCKKIYMYRNDVDALYSGYRFFIGKILDAQAYITPHQYATLLIFKGALEKNLMNLCDFWEHRKDPNVGFFFYDDMKEDHPGSVERIAKVMGIEASRELIEKVVSQSTFEFMSSPEHHLRFDEYGGIACIRRAVGLDYDKMPAVSGQKPRGNVKNFKVVQGGGLANSQSREQKKEVEGYEERAEVEECFNKTWDRIVRPRTGFANLDEMRAAWKSERAKMN